MHVTKLSRAVGLACSAMAATSAFAVDASNYNQPTANTRDIYISGASAQDNGILAMLLQECVSGSLTRYSINNNFAYICTTAATLNVGQPQVAVFKYSVGGSGSGVTPVNATTPLPFLSMSSIIANCNVAAVVTTFGTLTQPYNNVVCPEANSAILAGNNVGARLGLSDVEPSFFGNAATTSNLTTKSAIATLIFGVPVSRNIYKALQSQQILNIGNCTNTASSVSAPIWEYSNECMPSLSRSQIVSAFTASGVTWASIRVLSNLVDDTIYVARRVNSSGTQKTFEAIVTGSPNGDGFKSCMVETDPFRDPDTGDVVNGDVASACSSTTAPSVVFAGSGGSNVRNCLIAHNNNNRGAIGMLTAEELAGATTNWRFLKISGDRTGTDGPTVDRGYAPTHADVAAGRYQFWTIASLNYTSATANTAALVGLPGYIGANGFINRFRFQFADPVGLAIAQPFGPSGLMANWDLQAGNPALNFTGSTGVNPWSRKVGGATLNNCQIGKGANL